MNAYLIKTFPLILVLLSVFSCKQSDMLDSGSALNKEDLTIKSVDILSGLGSLSTTKSDGAGAADTSNLIICDTMMFTARVDLMGGDSSAVGTSTKGSLISSLVDIDKFKINLFNTGSSDFSPSASLTEGVTATNHGGVFQCSPSYKWTSQTDKVSLFAYYPVGNATNGLKEAATGLSVDYVVPVKSADQPDFCTTTGDRNIVNTYESFENYRTFGMNHRLTAVGLAINGWNVRVTKVVISGVSFSGTYDLVNNRWKTNDNGAESRTLDLTSVAPTDSYTGNPTWTDITPRDGYFMMIPQTLTDAAMISITYEGVSGNSDKGVIKASLQTFTQGEWEPGKRVTYNIQLRTAPAVLPTNITLVPKAGYTSTPVSFATLLDPNDVYTFEWSASWLLLSHGSPKQGDVTGGIGSGWTVNASDLLRDRVYFFANSLNASDFQRSVDVTVKGRRTAARSIRVTQGERSKISISLQGQSVEWDNGYVQVGVTSNTDWNLVATIVGSSVVPGFPMTISGNSNKTVTMRFPQNLSRGIRTISIQAQTLEGAYSTGIQYNQNRSNIYSRADLAALGWVLPSYASGLIVEPSTVEYCKWQTRLVIANVGSKNGLGMGYYNTYNIFTYFKDMPAVSYCKSLFNTSGPGYFLPTRSEYLVLRKLVTGPGAFRGEWLWTSEQYSAPEAYLSNGQNFDITTKTRKWYVRCAAYYTGPVPVD